jgi:hypothetical protein
MRLYAAKRRTEPDRARECDVYGFTTPNRTLPLNAAVDVNAGAGRHADATMPLSERRVRRRVAAMPEHPAEAAQHAGHELAGASSPPAGLVTRLSGA